MTTISSELFQSTGIVTFGMSTRHGGVSPDPLGMNLSFNVGDTKENVEKNRELFFASLGISGEHAAIPMQIHSNIVKRADAPGSYPACDGLITGIAGVALCVSVADCVPIFVVETRRRVIAAIHAGWRGTSSMIVQRGVNMMIEEFQCSPEHMAAYVGPGASTCCYSVGDEVAGKFSSKFINEHDGGVFVDLKSANVSQLVEAGVSRNAIEVSPYCTIGDSHLFHSYRRDKELSGRMMGAIALTSPVR